MHLFVSLWLTISSGREGLLTGFFGLVLVLLAAGIRRLEVVESGPSDNARYTPGISDVALGMTAELPVATSPEGLHQLAAHLYSKVPPDAPARLM